jgi:NADPH:quinone reductase-like Zn-dependent oxidoreductase
MKAAQFSRFGGPEVLEIVDLPDPHPGPGQVRVAVHAAGINATEWKLRTGEMSSAPGSPRPRAATSRAWSTSSATG